MSNPLELTPARIFAIFAAHYPGMVDRFLNGDLTDTQISALLEEHGFIRHLNDQAQLRYAFSKFSDEDCENMLRSSGGANPMRQRAWAEYAYRPYGLLPPEEGEQAAQPIPGMTREVADAICKWWERGDCPDDIWLQLLPWHKRIIATAGG